ncbi:HNH endonuclease [Hymenobacter yonginensis]|uniref:DUF7669 domain-containing protein n=1 Tax=Hymenobacter yonginensis TaxID=748197 RepID=A0ABY7PPC0_9BACT|nr:hypothetical protein [Hymenobacter yonginensis]WBO83835.1 hypothetical protein O9Z63_15815 [Hymenobacter yonginensis]
MERPAVWRMVKEAVEAHSGKASRREIKEYIHTKWQNVKDHTIICQIQLLTVNHNSRIHWSENQRPRLTNSNSEYDLFFEDNDKTLHCYVPNRHGIWEIHKIGDEKFSIRLFKPESVSHNDEEAEFHEGTPYQIIQTQYERNPNARAACLKHYGHSCCVCNFNFTSYYGKIGEYFIHVHHLNKISDIKKHHSIDPIKDLRPVCPNCHAMLHTSNPPLSIEDLQTIIIERAQ